MKKIFGTILALILFASSSYANTISADTLKLNIQELILKDYSSKTSADLDIKITMLPFQSITIPDGKISYVLINNNEELALTSREVKRVNILVNNKIQRSLSVPIEVKAYDEVLVAAVPISREQPINPASVKYKKINIADKSNFVVTKDMLKKDMIAKKEYRDGEFIDKRFVKVRPDVSKNTEVRIILNSDNGFQIVLDGIAKTDGTIGEYIIVENKLYNKIYTAKIIGENKVQVKI